MEDIKSQWFIFPTASLLQGYGMLSCYKMPTMSITMLYGIDIIPWIILHIAEYEEYLKMFCGILSVPSNISMDMNNIMDAFEPFLQFLETPNGYLVHCQSKN